MICSYQELKVMNRISLEFSFNSNKTKVVNITNFHKGCEYVLNPKYRVPLRQRFVSKNPNMYKDYKAVSLFSFFL